MNDSIPLPVSHVLGTSSVLWGESRQSPPEQPTSYFHPKVSVTTRVELFDGVEPLEQAASERTMSDREKSFVIRDMILGPLDEVRDRSREVVGFLQIA
jgi:hypothetical protein